MKESRRYRLNTVQSPLLRSILSCEKSLSWNSRVPKAFLEKGLSTSRILLELRLAKGSYLLFALQTFKTGRSFFQLLCLVCYPRFMKHFRKWEMLIRQSSAYL